MPGHVRGSKKDMSPIHQAQIGRIDGRRRGAIHTSLPLRFQLLKKGLSLQLGRSTMSCFCNSPPWHLRNPKSTLLRLDIMLSMSFWRVWTTRRLPKRESEQRWRCLTTCKAFSDLQAYKTELLLAGSCVVWTCSSPFQSG